MQSVTLAVIDQLWVQSCFITGLEEGIRVIRSYWKWVGGITTHFQQTEVTIKVIWNGLKRPGMVSSEFK